MSDITFGMGRATASLEFLGRVWGCQWRWSPKNFLLLYRKRFFFSTNIHIFLSPLLINSLDVGWQGGRALIFFFFFFFWTSPVREEAAVASCQCYLTIFLSLRRWVSGKVSWSLCPLSNICKEGWVVFNIVWDISRKY